MGWKHNICKSSIKDPFFRRNHASTLFCFDLKKEKLEKSSRCLKWDERVGLMSCWAHNCSSKESDGKVQKSPHLPSLTTVTFKGSSVSQWQQSVEHPCGGMSYAVRPGAFGQLKNFSPRSRNGTVWGMEWKGNIWHLLTTLSLDVLWFLSQLQKEP